MQFLVPSFLWAFGSLLIPIIIHFFHFRRTKKVYFSQVAFLRNIDSQTSSFRTLKQWLSLLLRLLALACLVLAFAQPFWVNKRNGLVAEADTFGLQSIYLDNSRSMENLADNKGLLDQAVIQLEEWLSIADVASSWQWMTNDRSAGVVSPLSPNQLKKKLAEVRFSDEAMTLEQVIHKQAKAADKIEKGGKRRFFYFSDFQKSTIGALSSLPFDTLDEYHFIPTLPTKTANIVVDSVWLDNPFLKEMTSSVLRVRVRNTGDDKVEKVVLRFLLDNQPVSSAVVSIPAKGQDVASFSFTIRDKGEHEGQLKIEDQPVTFDNTYHFVVVASPQIKVIHLFDEKPSRYIREVFQDDSFARYTVSTVRGVNIGSVSESNLIVLDGLSNFPSGLRDAVDKVIKKGGTVVVIPPVGSLSLDEYRTFLGTFGIESLELAPSSSSIPLAEPTVSSTFFMDIFDNTGAVEKGKMQVPEVKTKLAWKGVGEIIWQQQTGARFLTRTRQPAGGWAYLLASPMDASYGGFTEHAFFVATFLKIAVLSMPQQQMAYRMGNTQPIRLPYVSSAANTVLTLKRGENSFVPHQSIQGNEWVIQSPAMSGVGSQGVEPGIYEVWADGKYIQKIAFNSEVSESLLAHFSVEELKALMKTWPNVFIHEGIADSEVSNLFNTSSRTTPLWWYFALASLIFLLLEVLLLRFWRIGQKG